MDNGTSVEKMRREDDCPGCQKDKWNASLIITGTSSILVVLVSCLWGWAAYASNGKVEAQNIKLATLTQMVLDDRNARIEQTNIIRNIEKLGNNRNLMIQRVASKLGVQVSLN